MSNSAEISVFNFNKNQIRTILLDGEPWFVACDVCKVLEIKNTTQAVQKLDDDERSMLKIGRQGKANIVNEFGLYNITLDSRKQEAKRFKRWVTHEVLPSIRKTGGYGTISKMVTVDMEAIGEMVKKCVAVAVREEMAGCKVKAVGRKTIKPAGEDSFGSIYKNAVRKVLDEENRSRKDYQLSEEEAQVIEKMRSWRAFFGTNLMLELEERLKKSNLIV